MLSCVIPIFQVFQLIFVTVASAVLFAFAGLTLAGTVVALIVATPLFVIFSPVLVPATVATTLLATNLTAGALFGVTAIGLMIWLLKHRMGVKPKNNPPPKGAPPTAASHSGGGAPGGGGAHGGGGGPSDHSGGGSAGKPAGASTHKPHA